MEKKELIKIVISIPVHEKPDVIIDQIQNIKKYFVNAVIVLHISRSFFRNYSADSLYGLSDVYINPQNLETAWGNIIMTHVSNFEYISGLIDFDYFLMHSSNDMYVRYGVENYISKYDAGFCRREVLQKYSMWWPGEAAWNDRQLRNIMQKIGQTRIFATQIEGSFYTKKLAQKIMKIIKENYMPSRNDTPYTREEVYFSTIASSLVDFSRVGYPITYSEVHIFDRVLWKIRSITRFLFYRLHANVFIKESIYYKFESWYNDILFKSRFYKITKKSVNAVRNVKIKKLNKNSELCDYPGYFRLYDTSNLYSVKRITRNYSDKIRCYIRKLR